MLEGICTLRFPRGRDVRGRLLGALDVGPPMLHVDFKKWRMSLSFIFPNVSC